MADMNTPWDLASAVLTVIEDGYATAGVLLPDLHLVRPNVPVWNCEQVAVSILGLPTGTADALGPPQQCYAQRTLTLSAHVVRCFPTLDESGQYPNPAEIEPATETIAADLWLLPYVLTVESGALAGCDGVRILDAVIVGPTGGFVGARVDLRVTVE